MRAHGRPPATPSSPTRARSAPGPWPRSSSAWDPPSPVRPPQRALAAGPFDHVMVVGIAGGLDPALPVGSLMVPEPGAAVPRRPDLPHPPPPPAQAEGGLMTTDGLFADETCGGPSSSGASAPSTWRRPAWPRCARTRGVDWSVYRGISDRPDEHIVDQAVFGLSKPDGRPTRSPWPSTWPATPGGPRRWPT